jgi:hypothetical protein
MLTVRPVSVKELRAQRILKPIDNTRWPWTGHDHVVALRRIMEVGVAIPSNKGSRPVDV